MNEYDFSRLNDKEFEVFCTDLLGAHEGVIFERFKPGRDGGIDGRYIVNSETLWIVQCKHWAPAGRDQLFKKISVEEREKVIKLNPQRYILVVSFKLSPSDKKRLMEALSPFVKSPSDILGQEDLNDLLAKYPAVESRHYKLWLVSSNLMRYFMDKAIHDRSRNTIEEIISKSAVYTQTSNHSAAIERLEKYHVVVLTGAAGIGKTTLAEQLILHYVAQGYSLVEISKDVIEAESVYLPEEKQIFYFDDFLGRNYLEAVSGVESAEVVSFIRRVARDRNKRFVLTSRTTILSQGKMLSDVFENGNVHTKEYEITLDSLTRLDKANILYNHIWHSSLGIEFIDQIYESKRYRVIIDHKNFNPRLVQFITDAQRLENVAVNSYWQYAEGLLNNPEKVWDNVFDALLDDCGRALALLVAMNGREISEEALTEAFARYISAPGVGALSGKMDFSINVRHLSGSILTRMILSSSIPYLKLFNPSLGDYILARYCKNAPALRACFSSLLTMQSLTTISELVKNGFISSRYAGEFIDFTFRRLGEQEFLGVSGEYLANLCMIRAQYVRPLCVSDSSLIRAVEKILSADCGMGYMYSAQIILWALDKDIAGEDLSRIQRFLSVAFENHPSDREMIALGGVVAHMIRHGYSYLGNLYDEVVSYQMIEEFGDNFPEDRVFSDINTESSARARLKGLICELAEEYGAVDVSHVARSVYDSIDLEQKFFEHFNEVDADSPSPYDPPVKARPRFADLSNDEIDYLFSRNDA